MAGLPLQQHSGAEGRQHHQLHLPAAAANTPTRSMWPASRLLLLAGRLAQEVLAQQLAMRQQEQQLQGRNTAAGRLASMSGLGDKT